MAESNPLDHAHFANFDIIPATYKTVQNHNIAAHIFVPKTIIAQADPSRSYPLILRIHGGGLATGSSLFADWFPSWALELAHRYSAIIVSPNYRLAPEATIDDVLEDIEDFWKWVHNTVPALVPESTNGKVHVDTTRILTAGDSAGGFLSLHLGLNHPEEIRAVTAAYPMIDCKSDHFTTPKEGPIGFFPSIPQSVLDTHRHKVKNGELPYVVSVDDKLERINLMLCLFQNGLFEEILPHARREVHLLDRIQDGAKFPRGGVFVWHGKDDAVVPAEGSKKLKALLQEADPSLNFHLAVRDGDHGFDGTTKLDDEWFTNGMQDLIAAWLR